MVWYYTCARTFEPVDIYSPSDKSHKLIYTHTVDGRNPAPPGMHKTL